MPPRIVPEEPRHDLAEWRACLVLETRRAFAQRHLSGRISSATVLSAANANGSIHSAPSAKCAAGPTGTAAAKGYESLRKSAAGHSYRPLTDLDVDDLVKERLEVPLRPLEEQLFGPARRVEVLGLDQHEEVDGRVELVQSNLKNLLKSAKPNTKGQCMR